MLKKIIFWTYGRTTWQYDVLCALILAFIFLTPKSWFDTSERMRCAEHQKISSVSPLLPTAPALLPAKLPDMQVNVVHVPGMVVAYRIDSE